jgi:hypothetical protein
MIPPDLSVCYGINTVTDRGEKLVGKKKHKSVCYWRNYSAELKRKHDLTKRKLVGLHKAKAKKMLYVKKTTCSTNK